MEQWINDVPKWEILTKGQCTSARNQFKVKIVNFISCYSADSG